MSDDIQNVTPTEPIAAEQVQQVETNSPEATAEQTQQQEQDDQQKDEAAKKEPWFQKRINEQTRKFYEAQREAQALKERLAQYEQQHQPPDQQPQQPDVMTLAERIAEQKLAERSFNEACNKVYEIGTKELPEFDKAVSNLQLVGVTRDFLEATTASDAGHKLLHHLGQVENLAEAERILKLPAVQMGRELAMLEAKLNQPPPPKPVSKAPAPINPIGSGGATDTGLRDDLPIEEWMRRDRERKRSR